MEMPLLIWRLEEVSREFWHHFGYEQKLLEHDGGVLVHPSFIIEVGSSSQQYSFQSRLEHLVKKKSEHLEGCMRVLGRDLESSWAFTTNFFLWLLFVTTNRSLWFCCCTLFCLGLFCTFSYLNESWLSNIKNKTKQRKILTIDLFNQDLFPPLSSLLIVTILLLLAWGIESWK